MPKMPRILVVDDEKGIREGISDLLDSDFHITLAEDGEVALNILQKQTFDLVILDVMMPKINGYQVAEAIRDLKLNVPFVFLSAKAQTDNKIKGLTLGAEDYISKPFSEEELVLRIKRKILSQEKIELRNKRLKLMNHNIITPAGVIQGSTEVLAKLLVTGKKKLTATQAGDDCYLVAKKDIDDLIHQIEESISLISTSSGQLIKTVKNLTEVFYGMDSLAHKCPTSLSRFIYRSIATLKPDRLSCHISDAIPEASIAIDPDKMSELVFELLDNALLHNDNRLPAVTVTSRLDEGHAIISFSDNGRGIELGDREDIFKEFWTSYEEANHSRGHGIGLWLCQRHATAHSGKIWLEDTELGKGSTFSVSIPLSQ
ncbi:MAG: response regulator [Spirochaetota bacterium]|nr:response regulator [Spirochaetota bacterium]